MEDPANAVFSSWAMPIGPVVAILFLFIAYLRGWISLQFRVPLRFPLWRLLAFTGGLGTIFVAIASPLDAFGGLLLQVHMIHRFLLNPVVSWIAFTSSNVLWHLPFFYELALSSPAWHEFEHFCFLFTGLLFWWHLIQPWPSRPVWPRWAMVPYLILADLQNTGLAAFLTFYDRVLYPTYRSAPRLWGSNPLDDQVIAGTIMWVPGSIVFLVPAAIIALQFLSPRLGSEASIAKRSSSTAAGRDAGFVPLLRRLGLAPRPAHAPINLFRLPIVGGVLRSKTFRRGMQVVMLLLAIAILLDGFLGPHVSPMNLAGVLPWTHWRGLTVVALLLAGNLFCMICPFTLVRDFGRRWLPAKWIWPVFLRNKWLAAGLDRKS